MATKSTQKKLATFTYEGVDRQGKKVKGETSGKGAALVRAELRKQGINAKKVAKKREINLGGKKKVTPMDLSLIHISEPTRPY